MSAILVLIFKTLPAAIVFIFTMGIIDTKRFEKHPVFKGIIAILTAISTFLLMDQLYSIFTGKPSTLAGIVSKLKGDDTNKSKKEQNKENKTLAKSWNPKIYRGKRSYSVNSKHTIKDNYTGLIWQREDDGTKRTWKEAINYCNNLSLAGLKWRLPTQKELFYLTDISKYKPAIDTKYFKVKNDFYWSSTPHKKYSSNAWGVNFGDGNDYWNYKKGRYYVLCVSGQ